MQLLYNDYWWETQRVLKVNTQVLVPYPLSLALSLLFKEYRALTYLCHTSFTTLLSYHYYNKCQCIFYKKLTEMDRVYIVGVI